MTEYTKINDWLQLMYKSLTSEYFSSPPESTKRGMSHSFLCASSKKKRINHAGPREDPFHHLSTELPLET